MMARPVRMERGIWGGDRDKVTLQSLYLIGQRLPVDSEHRSESRFGRTAWIQLRRIPV